MKATQASNASAEASCLRRGRDKATTKAPNALQRLKAERDRAAKVIRANFEAMAKIELFGVKSSQAAWERLARETAREMRIKSKTDRRIRVLEGK